MKTENNNCIFCKKEMSKIGKEHIVSDWILKYLNYKIQAQPFFETQFKEINTFNVESESKLHKEISFNKFLSPYICHDCNTGWMSKIESKIALILKPIIAGNKELVTLTKSEKLLIARWAIKTTCVIESINFSELSNFSFDSQILKDRQTMPPGWAVFAFTHQATSTIGWLSNNVWFIEGILSDELKVKAEECKKTIFQLKNLIIATIYIGDARLKLKAVKPIHFPINVNLNYEWVLQPTSPSFTTYKNVEKDSSDDLMFRFLGAFSLCIV